MHKLVTVSVIVPVFNERDNLPELFDRLRAVRERLHEVAIHLEVIIVDDHSSDETATVVREFKAAVDVLKVIRLSRNCGAFIAIRAGLQHCSGACAVVMAADLQDPPELILELVERWRSGYHVVWAQRSAREGESLWTRASARVYYWIMRVIAEKNMPATGADFFLLDRKIVDLCCAIGEKHSALLPLIHWMGFKQTSIGYVKKARRRGKTKWTFLKKVNLFVESVVGFSYVPIRLASLLGAIVLFTGIICVMVMIVGRLLGRSVGQGGLGVIMSALLVGHGSILMWLGILGEYVWRMFQEARGRPLYLIEDTWCSCTEESRKEPHVVEH